MTETGAAGVELWPSPLRCCVFPQTRSLCVTARTEWPQANEKVWPARFVRPPFYSRWCFNVSTQECEQTPCVAAALAELVATWLLQTVCSPPAARCQTSLYLHLLPLAWRKMWAGVRKPASCDEATNRSVWQLITLLCVSKVLCAGNFSLMQSRVLAPDAPDSRSP